MNGATKLTLTSLLLVFLVACASPTGHKVLKVFFDGVPEPGSEETPPRVVDLVTPETVPTAVPEEPPEPVAADLVAGGFAAIDELPLRPVPKITGEDWVPTGSELEKAATWEDALRILPTDIVGGVDWVAAVQRGLTIPQLVLEAEASVPYTLDTLVAGGAELPGSPFLDFTVEIMSQGDDPIFKATFPHSSHTLFLACSSCHPGVRSWDVPMEKILAGQACGKCHGRVSFAPETGCPRCHESLAPPAEDLVEGELARARQEQLPSSPELLARGQTLYAQYCAFCHGEAGDGEGRLARWLTTKPRDFTRGTYKFKSVFGPLPTDLDLFRTITRGVPGTSMPAWTALAFEDRWALVHYVKAFSDWFQEEKPGEPLTVPETPVLTAELRQIGESIYKEAGCNACHGDSGGGDGPSAKTLKDNWGQPIRPYPFASGRPMKSGTELRDIFRVVNLGLGGTPMPGFAESLAPRQIWAVASFVSAFRGQAPEPFAVKGDILFERPKATQGNGTAGTNGAPEAAGGDSFWGDDAEEEEDGGGDSFWGDDAEEEPEDTGDDFWGDDAEEEPEDTGDDFWGDDAEEEPADAGDDFWGDAAEDGEGDDGGDSFWAEDEDDSDSSPGGLAADPHEIAGAPVEQPEVPPATFPHWLHRVRLKCANCHPRVFEMKAGANPINMDAMRAGLFCAKCHNGEIAWQIGFTNCPRCHQARPTP